LAVDHPRRGARRAAGGVAGLPQKLKVDPLEQAAVPPVVEIPLHRRERRKVLRQHAPLASAARNIQDRIQHRAQVGLPRPAQALGSRHKGRDHRPLAIGKVACITLPRTLILRSSDFGPHVVPPGLLTTTRMPQLTEITQFISGQPLSTISASTWVL
jgi:hypothetical protein